MNTVRSRLLRAPFWVRMTLWSAALAVLLTWPTLLYLNGVALGSADGDGLKHLWTVWRIRHELLGLGQLPYSTELVNFPTGMQLYPIEPLNGLAATALGFLPVVAVCNLLALVNLTLMGVCAGLLGKELGGNAWAGFAAGTLLEGSSVALFTIHVGVGELQHLWWLPLGMLAWIRLRQGLAWRHAVWLGAALAAATLSCFYHGFFLAIAVASMSLLTLWAGRATPRLLARYAVAAGLGLAVILPVMRGFSSSYGADEAPAVGLQAYVLQDHGQPLTDPPSARLEPKQLVAPATARRADTGREMQGYGGGRYLGLIALLLGLGGLVVAPRAAAPWVLTGALGVVIALGSYFVRGAEDVLLDGGGRLQLPFLYMNRALGYFAEPVNFPVRFLAITVTSLSALTALAASRGPGVARLVAALAVLSVIDVQVNQLTPRPMATLEPWQYPELEALADSEPGPLLDLSLAARADVEVRWASMSAQLAHQQPIQGVHIDRVQFFAQEGQHFTRALPLVQALSPVLSSGRWGEGPPPNPKQRFADDLALLSDAGFKGLLVLGFGGTRQIPKALSDFLTELLGPPRISGSGSLVYLLPQIDSDPVTLSAIRAAHGQRVEALVKAEAGRFGPQLR